MVDRVKKSSIFLESQLSALCDTNPSDATDAKSGTQGK